MKLCLLFFFLFQISVYSDIKALNGQIKFDVNSDNQEEATLNATGLGIGITPSSNLHVDGNAIISNQLQIGSSSIGGSNFNLSGTLSLSGQVVSSNTLIDTASLIFADTSDNNLTLTVPYAANVLGRQLFIKKLSDTNDLYIRANGNTIDNYITLKVPSNTGGLPSVKLMSDGQKWNILDLFNFSGNHVVTEDIFAWYNFDAVSGNSLVDENNATNNGTLKDPSGSFALSGEEGISGHGVKFNGTDEYIEIDAGSSSDYDLSGSNFSLSLWFKANSPGYIFNVGASSFTSDHVTLLIESNGELTFSYSPGGSQNPPYQLSGNVIDGAWHHVVGIRNGARTGQVYLDGVLVHDDVDTTGSLSGVNISSNAFIGSSTSGSDFYDGYVDEFRFYDRVLSEEEIQLLYFPQ